MRAMVLAEGDSSINRSACGRNRAQVSSIFAIIVAYYRRDSISNATLPSPRSHLGVDGVIARYIPGDKLLSIINPSSGRAQIDNRLDKAPDEIQY